jgi:hypothetical protein
MSMRAVTKLALSLAAGAALIAGASSASAAAGAKLNPASPPNYSGACPAVITFTGFISSTTPGPVTFQWYRSDGAHGPVETRVFSPSPTAPSRPQAISTTWTLGGPGLNHYSGWEAVRILSPAGPPSNKATFTMNCWIQRTPTPLQPK